MNRLLKSLVLFLAVAFLSCLHAEAQNCGPWLGVTSWNVTYTISGTGGGSDGQEYNWTISHQGSGNALLSPQQTQCTPQLEWAGYPTGGSGSINDFGTGTCTNGNSNTLSFVGSGPLDSNISGTFLTIDVTNGTYTFLFYDGVPITTNTDSCGTVFQDNGNLNVGPFASGCPDAGGLTFPLPSTVQVLTQTNFGFTADANCPPWAVSLPWTLSFTLTPILANNKPKVDHPCPPNVPVGSSIACQNQSLREDVPIVGTGFFLHYESDRAPGAGASTIATTDAGMIGGWTLSVHHAYDPSSNTLFLGDGSQRSAWQLAGSLPYNGGTLVTSEDGNEIYSFDVNGRHLETLKPLTGAVKYQFAYDSAGNLFTVTDGSGNITTVERDGSEHATAIVSPYAQSTNLAMDSNGFLSALTDPKGNLLSFANTPTGLLQSRTDANGNLFSYAYDSQGRLTSDSDAVGGSTILSGTDSSSGYSVTTTTAMGRTATFQVTIPSSPGEQFTNTWPNGLQATATNTQQTGQLSENSSLPDGTLDIKTFVPDQRWGLQAQVLHSRTLTLGGLAMSVSGSRTASLGTAGNPFSLTGQTDIKTVNGRTYKTVFTAANLTSVATTPVKRTTTTVFDTLERISSKQVGTLLPVKFAYDGHGRISTVTQGTRIATLAYDASGLLSSITDPLKLTSSFTHDGDGHLLTQTLPDGRLISYAYDGDGNVTSVTPPGKSAHTFSYGTLDFPSGYTPPAVAGTGSTTFTYNFDHDLTTITRPDGETINYGYDSAGRLNSMATPTEAVSYSYDSLTGNLDGASIAGGEAIAYGFNGPLPTSSTWTGTVAGSLSRMYNNNFWVTSQSINSNTINFTYDNDGLTSKAGSLVIKRNAKDGLITGTTLGSATDVRVYDTYGELTGLTAKYLTTVLYTVKFTRDSDGRITGKTETIGGKKNIYTYSYDAAGRLTGVKDGTSISSYTYDSNSNRLTATTSSGTVNGTYDAQDRLLTYGAASYTYSANGELASQTLSSQTTSYRYDVLGNLIAATLPNGTKITYIIDPENHRVGKEVNGVLQTGFLYDGSRIAAQLNGSNAIVSQFIYASSATTPDYMVSGSVTYRIFSDQLGSPRLVVDTATGAITEQIGYDEFGNVIGDTNPGFQPFGFAGGLYDQDTKFVRFGARDYNPANGRWTAKDPILFAGGDTNLYGYVLDDPINWTDPSGEAGYFQAVVKGTNSLWNYIASTLTSWGVDVGSAATQNQPAQGQPAQDQPVDPVAIAIDAVPTGALPGLGPAAQIALDSKNALDICQGIRALFFGGGVNLQRANAAAQSK